MPKFLLAGFTASGKADGALHVMSMRDGRAWMSSPDGAAHQRDYYRIEAPDIAPDSFETALSFAEARAADAIRDAVGNLTPPTGDALDDLIWFVALMAARTPPTLDHHARQEEQFLRMGLEIQIRHPKGFARMKEELGFGDDVTREGLLESLASVGFKFGSNWTVQQVAMHADALFPMLMRRRWSLIVPPIRGGYFVCSDMPAVVHDPTPRPEGIGPGFMAPASEFTMPLTRHVCLTGRFDRPRGVYPCTAKDVAVINARSLMYARHAYSTLPNFTWWSREQRIDSAASLRAELAANPRNDDADEWLA